MSKSIKELTIELALKERYIDALEHDVTTHYTKTLELEEENKAMKLAMVSITKESMDTEAYSVRLGKELMRVQDELYALQYPEVPNEVKESIQEPLVTSNAWKLSMLRF